MSCLKSAGTIFANLDTQPKEKGRLTIQAARHFEKYINDGSPGELPRDPETQDHPYQDLEDDLDCGRSTTGKHKKPRS